MIKEKAQTHLFTIFEDSVVSATSTSGSMFSSEKSMVVEMSVRWSTATLQACSKPSATFTG